MAKISVLSFFIIFTLDVTVADLVVVWNDNLLSENERWCAQMLVTTTRIAQSWGCIVECSPESRLQFEWTIPLQSEFLIRGSHTFTWENGGFLKTNRNRCSWDELITSEVGIIEYFLWLPEVSKQWWKNKWFQVTAAGLFCTYSLYVTSLPKM